MCIHFSLGGVLWCLSFNYWSSHISASIPWNYTKFIKQNIYNKKHHSFSSWGSNSRRDAVELFFQNIRHTHVSVFIQWYSTKFNTKDICCNIMHWFKLSTNNSIGSLDMAFTFVLFIIHISQYLQNGITWNLTHKIFIKRKKTDSVLVHFSQKMCCNKVFFLGYLASF